MSQAMRRGITLTFLYVGMTQPMIPMLDNYDSFTWNIVQYLWELGAEVVVKRNDEVDVADIERLAPDGLCISPGPCSPKEAGISMQVIEHLPVACPFSECVWGSSPLARFLAVILSGRPRSCTARPVRSTTGAMGFLPGCQALHRHPLPQLGGKSGDTARLS